ncbi:MAG: heparinase II/III family protein [Chthoniobacteraceae bacterium]
MQSEVAATLEENKAAWSEKINAIGSPCLLLDRAGLEAAKARLMADPRPPEAQALLDHAAKIAQRYPLAYQPRQGTDSGSAEELWMRSVGDDLVALAVAQALDPHESWERALHDGVIEACKYPQWGVIPGMENMDLACAHVARGVALAWNWYPQLWTEEDRQLILKAIDERVSRLLAGLYGKAYWASQYANNHNHVDCTGLGWCGLAFYNDLPQAPEWLAAARLNFQKVGQYFPQDGSSAEGVPYWSYAMSFILQYIEGTRFVTDSGALYQAPFLKNAASYRLNASTPGFVGTLPWGDAPLKDFYGPQHLLNRLGVEENDASAVWVARHIPWKPEGGGDVLAMNALWALPVQSRMPVLELDHRQSVTEMAVTRSGWGVGDYVLAIKAGFTNRNHSHLDAGALAFAFASEWLLMAPGYGDSQGSPDFWEINGPRWTYFTNATESHSTLLINNRNQRFDSDAKATIDAFLSTPYWSWTGVDLTNVYVGVNAVRREVLHRRGDYILVFDSVLPKAPATVEWLAQLPEEPEREGNAMKVRSGSGQLRMEMLSPAEAFAPRQPTSPRVNKKNIHTYAVKANGEKAQFIALLQPSFSADAMPELKVTLEQPSPGLERVVIQGADWSDEIYHGETEAALQTKAGVSAQAKALSIRTEKGSATSVLAVGARRVALKGITVSSGAPAQIGIQQIPGGSWMVDSDQELEIVAAKYAVQPFENVQKPYRYLLAKGSMTRAKAEEWLQSLLVFREAKQVPVQPLAKQPAVPSSVMIPVEAEDFALQKRGHAEVVEGRKGANGKSVRNFGYGATEHLISWDIQVGRAGQYQLMVRYTTDLSDVSLGVMLDGAAPLLELAKLTLPSTGGWSVKENNWKDLVLSDASGKPLIFNLAQGKHRLSLINPSGAIGLDRLEFKGAGKP